MGSSASRSIRPSARLQRASPSLDHQQATVLSALYDAQGAPVSLAELHDAGVEFPASVVSELELAGVPIERSLLRADGDKAVGVQLDPAWRRTPAEAPPGQADPTSIWPAPTCAATSRWATRLADLAPRMAAVRRPVGAAAGRLRTRAASLTRASPEVVRVRWLAPVALVAALAAVAAIAVAELAASGPRREVVRTRHGQSAVASANATGSSLGVHPSRRIVHARPPVPISPRLAVALQARGHELLERADYAEAASVLTRALAATGESLRACAEPVGDSCLTYAYALYDLGRALALIGHRAEAVSVLERRLQIDNQRATVAAELARARAQAG
jgi:hypothetical protein